VRTDLVKSIDSTDGVVDLVIAWLTTTSSPTAIKEDITDKIEPLGTSTR